MFWAALWLALSAAQQPIREQLKTIIRLRGSRICTSWTFLPVISIWINNTCIWFFKYELIPLGSCSSFSYSRFIFCYEACTVQLWQIVKPLAEDIDFGTTIHLFFKGAFHKLCCLKIPPAFFLIVRNISGPLEYEKWGGIVNLKYLLEFAWFRYIKYCLL